MPSYYLRRYHKGLRQWVYLHGNVELSDKARLRTAFTSEQLAHMHTENYEKVEIKMDKPKYKVGDKVRIVADLNGDWLGKVMTIRSVEGHEMYRMEEDKHERQGRGWLWAEDMFEGLISNEAVIAELIEERRHFEAKADKIRMRLRTHDLSDNQQSLLRASEYLFRLLMGVKTFQIKDLEEQAAKPKPVKKYNILNPDSDDGDPYFFFRSDDDTLKTAGSDCNEDEDQQWTLDQIKEWHLQAFPKFEVKRNA